MIDTLKKFRDLIVILTFIGGLAISAYQYMEEQKADDHRLYKEMQFTQKIVLKRAIADYKEANLSTLSEQEWNEYLVMDYKLFELKKTFGEIGEMREWTEPTR